MRATNPQQRMIDDAQTKISQILKDLEAHTGMLVQNIRVRSVDVRTTDDARPECVQCVEIEMYRLPGHHW